MKLKKLNAACIVACMLLSNLFFAQNKNQNFKNDLDKYMETVIESLGIPGLGVVVVIDNQTISEGYGFANYEDKILASHKTNYYIASSTKSFTGLLAVILDSEGIIKLDDNLAKYFPNLKLNSEIDLSKVKIRDLLTHTSGIDNGGIGWRVAYTGEHNQELLMDLMNLCTNNKAGYGNYQYANIGYNIYAIILEKITGKSWKDWMQEKIFNPLNLNHTSAYISRAEKESWELARPYNAIGSIKRIKLEKKDNTMQSAGGLIITPQDMGKWLRFQLSKGKLEGNQIIPKELVIASREKLASIPESRRSYGPTHYGMGWTFGKYKTEEIIHHFGGFAGFSTHVSFIPNKQLGVAIFINEGLIGSHAMNLIANSIYDYLIDDSESKSFDYEGLMKFSEIANQQIGKMLVHVNDRAKRTWKLSKIFSEYSGQFINKRYGTVVVNGNKNKIEVSFGNLHCEATPYVIDDSIRVELIPGQGEVIQFIIEKEKIIGFEYAGDKYKKVDKL